MKRQPRSLRRRAVVVKIMPRDEALLRALARFGVCRTPDLVHLLFPGVRADTAAARLRRAYDAGLLEVRSGDRSKPNLYSLGPEGRAWARAHAVTVARVPRGDLEHHLRIVAFWCGLANACHERGDVRLRRFTPDWELRRSARAPAVVPDALIELLPASQAPVQLALEVDRGGERAREWRAKLDRCARVEQAAVTPAGLVVLAVGGARRRDALAELVRRAWLGWSVVMDADTPPVHVLRAVLQTAAAPLTASPCSKGR